MRARQTIALAILAMFLAGCEREDRPLRQQPSSISAPSTIRVSGLYPGTNPPPASAGQNPFEDGAYTVSEGKRLFDAYNCSGCHAHGGGAIGPPLMDEAWIYGSEPNNIFATIMEGRPNGMPSFRGKVPQFQAWELVAYVRSMSGLVAKDVAPNRSDHMSNRRPENATEEQKSRDTFYSPQQEPK